MAMGYSRSCVLRAAARLQVADALGDDEHSVEELAASCGADASSLYRLLRALATLGVVSEKSPRRFVLTVFGSPLRKNAPCSVWPAVVFWSDLLADSWSRLTECVKEGKTASGVMEKEGIASRWSKDPEASAIFRAVMGTGPAENYAPIARKWNFTGRKVIADLGGGGGALLAAVLDVAPDARGILVDLPASIDAARPRFEHGDLAARCTLIAADLLETVPAGADVYMIKHVLHGRSDDKAIAILRNCRKAVPANGRLLIIEFLLPDVVSRADSSLESRFMSDLNMMVVTGGKERNSLEWSALLGASGFEPVQTIPVPELEVAIIEARPGEAERNP